MKVSSVVEVGPQFVNASAVSRELSNSGGIQKETYILKIPCITLKENKEWYETIENGRNVLLVSNKDKDIQDFNEFNSLIYMAIGWKLKFKYKDRFDN